MNHPRRLSIDDEHAPIYAVGQVAEMLGVQPAFVRRLDSEGVVQPTRSDGGQRRYTRAEIVQVQRVAAMADEGMTLVGIRRIFELELEVADLKRQLAAHMEGGAPDVRHLGDDTARPHAAPTRTRSRSTRRAVDG